MGACCQPNSKRTAPDRTPSHLRHRQQSSTFKNIRSGKDLSQLAKQRHLYRLTGRRILIYNTDINLAWAEDLSLRQVLDGHYMSVKTGPNQLFLLQAGLVLLVDVDLLTGMRKPEPPVTVGKCSMGYYDRRVYVAAHRLLVFDLDQDVWEDLPMPSNYLQHCGVFLLEHKLYLVGGLRDNQARRDVLVYSLQARSWLSSTVELPVPMQLPTCVSMENGQALVCCGFNAQNSSIPSAYLFDLVGFQAVPDITVAFEASPVMAISYRQRCYIMRGDGVVACWQAAGWHDLDAEGLCYSLTGVETVESAGKDGDDIEGLRALIPKRSARVDWLYCYCASFRQAKSMVEFNTLSLECREVDYERFLAPIPRYAGYGLLPGGKVLFAGGVDERNTEVDSCLEYDGAAQSLVQGAPLPSPQAFVFTCLATERLYALGSLANTYAEKARKLPLDSFFQEYALGQWTKLPPPDFPLLFACICHLGGFIFTFGGVAHVHSEYAHSLIFEFTIQTRNWRRLETQLPATLGWLTAVNTLQNRILCFGGEDLQSRESSTATWSFDGKGFKQRASAPYHGRTCLATVSRDTRLREVLAVDLVGVGHCYSLDSGQWKSI